MHPNLQALVDEFEAAGVRLHQVKGRFPESAFSRRPPAGGWSAAECVAHLNLTAEAYLPLIDEALAAARRLDAGAPRRLRKDLFGWLIWQSSRPGGRMKVQTTPAFVPTSELPLDGLVAEFNRIQDELIERTRAADGLPIHRVKITSVFNDRVRYSTYSALSILAVHQHRHLEQAERALAAVGDGTAA